jgi:pimeloyl-ACP methyl ester carboxylesterase
MPSVTEQRGGVRQRVVLIHGAATTSRIWDAVIPYLDGFDVVAPDRASSGDLDTEIADLTPLCAGAIVVGVSGGATLGLELATRGCGATAVIVHEPAVGSLAPGMLDAFAAAFAAGGVTGFAAALYGPSWQPTNAPASPDAVSRDLAMFRGFEPRAPATGSGPVIVTVGQLSPPIRHRAAAALHDSFGLEVRVLPATSHAVHLDNPAVLAQLIREVATSRT